MGCRVYKPRRPRESPLYRLVERHLEELLRVWPERFARRHGPLRAAVERLRGVPALRSTGARLCPALVRLLPPARSGRLLLLRPQLLPVLREEEAVALGGVAVR
jgi:hypothetical protein